MKTIYFYLLGILFLFSCTSPQKLIEQGKYEKAFYVSLKKLKSGKVKPEHLGALEHTYAILCAKDRATYEKLSGQKQAALWPMIYEKSLGFSDRQRKVRAVETRLNHLGYYPTLNHLPVKAWIAESRRNASIYFYGLAQELIPTARNGNRLAARKAHGYLERCNLYESNFRDVPQLQEEMFALGTTHILLNPRLNPRKERLTTMFYDILFDGQAFPFRDNWQVFHFNQNEKQAIHYELDLFFSKLYVSGDDCSTSCCSNSEEVICGYQEVEVWSEKDSAYVKEQEPIYETISVTVTTYNQSKEAFVDLQSTYRGLAKNREVHQERIRAHSSWSNSYGVAFGDERALTIFCDAGGSPASFPARNEMLRAAARNLRRKFYRNLQWDIDKYGNLEENLFSSGR